jgi:predicted peptidase
MTPPDRSRLLKLCLAATAISAGVAAAAWCLSAGEGYFLRRHYRDLAGEEFIYRVFVPSHYTPDRTWPLVLSLHGSGDSGDDGEAQIRSGLAAEVRRRQHNVPFLAVFPQSLDLTWDAASDDGKRAVAILDEVCREFRVDLDRVYLTGFSMGGGGTWSLARAHPERWAAIAPVCGYGNPAWAPPIRHIPCWCFHGASDGVISVEESRAMVRALREAGGSPRYTEYPDVGHDWRQAYGSDELYEWLLKQRRKPEGPDR